MQVSVAGDPSSSRLLTEKDASSERASAVALSMREQLFE
jgi:hypothetical protein